MKEEETALRAVSSLSSDGKGSLLLLTVAVAVAELVDAACGVDELLLAGEERVRRACDFELHEGILLAVDFDCLAGSHG